MACRVMQEGRDRVEETEPGLCGILEVRRQGDIWPALPYLRHNGSNVCYARPHLSAQLFAVPSLDTRPHDLHPWPVGGRADALVAPAPEHQSASSLGMRHKLPGRAGFANTRLANEHYQATPADERVLQGRLQCREFCRPAHKDAFGKPA